MGALLRALSQPIDDVHAIALNMKLLPDLEARLSAIQRSVDSLDDEFKRMRASVDSMGGDVVQLRDSAGRISEVADRFRFRRSRKEAQNGEVAVDAASDGASASAPPERRRRSYRRSNRSK